MFSTLFSYASLIASVFLVTNVQAVEQCGQVQGKDVICAQESVEPCAGDTRGDQRCNKDVTHRVCAKIGNADTSFFQFTGQANIGKDLQGWTGLGWCGTHGSYDLDYSPRGHDIRCPADNPTWCICKWATANWIKGAGCNDGIEIDCDSSDVCNTPNGLFFSYYDGGVDLEPAHKCVPTKCPEVWQSCCDANPAFCDRAAVISDEDEDVLEVPTRRKCRKHHGKKKKCKANGCRYSIKKSKCLVPRT